MQSEPAATRPGEAGRSRSAVTAPTLGVLDDPRTLFADENDAAGSAAPAPVADQFALFPDENHPTAPAFEVDSASAAPFVFEHTTAERAERDYRTVTITPRLILLAVILFGVAFGAVTSCEAARSAAPGLTW